MKVKRISVTDRNKRFGGEDLDQRGKSVFVGLKFLKSEMNPFAPNFKNFPFRSVEIFSLSSNLERTIFEIFSKNGKRAHQARYSFFLKNKLWFVELKN